MRFSDFIYRNKAYLLVLGLIFIIPLFIAVIFLIDSRKTQTFVSSPYTKDFLALERKIKNTYNYSEEIKGRMGEALDTLGSSSSDENKYKALNTISTYVSITYSDTNDPNYKSLVSDIDKFARDNFPKLYVKGDFGVACQDASCADSSQPKEILALIQDIKSSDLEDYLKDSVMQNLMNTGYLSDNYPIIKFEEYYSSLFDLRNYSRQSSSSALPNIETSLANYIESKYPREFKEAESLPPLRPEDIKKLLKEQ